MTLRIETAVMEWRGALDDADPSRGSQPPAERTSRLETRVVVRAARPDARTVQAAVADAFADHNREIFSFALHGTRSTEAAEDVTQETFFRLLCEIGDGRRPDNVRAWLYRVSGNLVVSRGRRQTVAGRWLTAIARTDVATDTPEKVTIGREAHRGLVSALATLPRDARVGLLMAAQGFSGREAAAAIGRSEPATRTMLCRSRRKLRQLLEQPDPLT